MSSELGSAVDGRQDDLNGLASESLDGVDSVRQDRLDLASGAGDSGNSGVLLVHELCKNMSIT